MSFDTDPAEDIEAEMRKAFADRDKRIAELERQIERMKKALELIACGQQHGQTTGPMRAYQMQNVAKEALKEE